MKNKLKLITLIGLFFVVGYLNDFVHAAVNLKYHFGLPNEAGYEHAITFESKNELYDEKMIADIKKQCSAAIELEQYSIVNQGDIRNMRAFQCPGHDPDEVADVVIEGDIFDPSVIPSGNIEEEKTKNFKIVIKKIWNVLSLALKVCSVLGVVYAGVTYMFASGDAKYKLKQSLPYLITGVVIVFGSSLVVDFIVRSFAELAS